MGPFVAFLVHQATQKGLDLSISFLDSYADPVCLGALGLHSILLERRLAFGVSKLSSVDILTVTLLLAVVSEVVFPWFSDDFVADWWDVVGIFLGALWFVTTQPSTGRGRLVG